jgi:hypothetical protein
MDTNGGLIEIEYNALAYTVPDKIPLITLFYAMCLPNPYRIYYYRSANVYHIYLMVTP